MYKRRLLFFLEINRIKVPINNFEFLIQPFIILLLRYSRNTYNLFTDKK